MLKDPLILLTSKVDPRTEKNYGLCFMQKYFSIVRVNVMGTAMCFIFY